MTDVTLHVSVWVEIYKFCHRKCRKTVTLHVSVWVEISHVEEISYFSPVTLHVSVWVEIKSSCLAHAVIQSRSTWACELKSNSADSRNQAVQVTLHVSVWVEILFVSFSALSRPVTLHVSVWVEILVMIILLSLPWSRSTWACELKSELLRGADHREAVTLHVRIWLVICMSRILRCVVYIVFS